MDLSPKQRDVLAFIERTLARTGQAPTQLEICAAFGWTQNAAANYHLRALEAAGAISRVPGLPRSIRLGNRGARHEVDLSLPILGRVAAGSPIGADAGHHGELTIDARCFTPRPDYLLRVHGDSMRDDGILDGDLVAVKRCEVAESGQTVIARLDGELTIKRLQLGKTGIRLLPRNPAYPPIEVPADADFAIEGRYCGLVRGGDA